MATPEQIAMGIPARANIVKIVDAPGGGKLALGADGGVFALGGAQFHGAYTQLAAEDRQGNRSFKDIQVNPDGSYKLISNIPGQEYNFGPKAPQGPAPNSLYQDPAFLAFLRSSDLSLETAAGDVARKQRAYQDALQAQTGNIEQNRTQASQGKNNSFEARGVYRSGQREVQQGQLEQDYAQQLAAAQAQTAGQVGELQQGLAEKVAEQQRQAAEKGYGVAGQQELATQQENLRKKYPTQYPSL